MSFVYRYVDKKDFTIKYIGLVNGDDYSNLRARINGHRSDDWSNDSTFEIDFIVLKTKNDAETLEAHLIAKYKTYEYYNKAKCNWGLSSFINTDNFKWLRFDRKVKSIEKCKKIIKCEINIDFDKSLLDQFSNNIDLLNDYISDGVYAIETNNGYVIPVSYIYNCVNQSLDKEINDLMCVTNKDYCLYKIKELEEEKEKLCKTINQQKQIIKSLTINKENQKEASKCESVFDNGFSSILSKDDVRYLFNQNGVYYFYCSYYDKNGDVIQKQVITKDCITKYLKDGSIETIEKSDFRGDYISQIAYKYLWSAKELGLLKCNDEIGAINCLIDHYEELLKKYRYWQNELSISSLSEALAKLNTYKTVLFVW